MFERILVPLDGSPRAESILPQVRKILLHKDAEVVLFKALPSPPMMEGDLARVMELDRSDAEAYLRGLETALAAEGARVRCVLREGDPGGVIPVVAAEEKASLVAMSTHGRTGVPRLVLGSVAEQVLRASPVPLLMLKSFRPLGGELSLRKILVPVDPDKVSLEVLDAAIELATLFGARVTLLHVMPDLLAYGPPVPEMTRAFERFRRAGVEAEPVLRKGDPAEKILAAVREEGADLIAMATHGRSGLPRMMLGSVAEKVLRGAEVPLLVVRGPRVAASLAQAS